ncbi:MAG: tellurium resistance protein, partial [Pseudomonadota bacterium]
MAINLEKGQKISLAKESGTTLTKVVMGLGWDAKQNENKGGLLGGLFGGGSSEVDIDLDASCI